MNDLHDAFGAWIAGGARDELARDVAVHASGCDECLAQAAALDALLAVDPDAAPEPPLRVAPIPGSSLGPMRVARAAAGAIAVLLVIGAGAIAGSNIFPPRATGQAASVLEPTPGGAVLAGEGAPSVTATPSPTIIESPTPTASPSPSVADATPAIAAATPRPTMGGGPPPISTAPAATPLPATPLPATPRPSVAPTSAPTPEPTSMPTPDATPTPTPTPTAVPTQTPTPTPAPTLPTDETGTSSLIGGIAELLP